MPVQHLSESYAVHRPRIPLARSAACGAQLVFRDIVILRGGQNEETTGRIAGLHFGGLSLLLRANSQTRCIEGAESTLRNRETSCSQVRREHVPMAYQDRKSKSLNSSHRSS